MKVEIGPDGKIVKLPWQLLLTNALLNAAYPALLLAALQWLYNTQRASKDGRVRWPHTVRGFNYLVGVSCADIMSVVWQYGIPTQTFSLQFDLWPDRKGIGLVFSFWVPATQAAMADDILRQHAASLYAIDSKRMGTGARFGKPWGVAASTRSFDQWILTMLHRAIGGRLDMQTSKGKPFVQKRKGKSK